MATPLLPDFGRASEPIVSTTVAPVPARGFDDRRTPSPLGARSAADPLVRTAELPWLGPRLGIESPRNAEPSAARRAHPETWTARARSELSESRPDPRSGAPTAPRRPSARRQR